MKANKYQPLDFKLVPDFITHYWQSYAQLVAGIILLISVPFRGTKFTDPHPRRCRDRVSWRAIHAECLDAAQQRSPCHGGRRRR